MAVIIKRRDHHQRAGSDRRDPVLTLWCAIIASMARVMNLADPDFEPSDAQLAELSTRAFATVRDDHERSLSKLRTEIAQARARALSALEVGPPNRDPT